MEEGYGAQKEWKLPVALPAFHRKMELNSLFNLENPVMQLPTAEEPMILSKEFFV